MSNISFGGKPDKLVQAAAGVGGAALTGLAGTSVGGAVTAAGTAVAGAAVAAAPFVAAAAVGAGIGIGVVKAIEWLADD